MSYELKYLPQILYDSDDSEELINLLCNYQFIKKKILELSIDELLTDYQLTNAQASKIIENALRLSAFIIKLDPNQLPTQLANRLYAYQDFPEIQALLEGINKETLIWFSPYRIFLEQAVAPLQDTLFAHDGIIYCCAIAPAGDFIVTASSDKTLRIWDLQFNKLRLILRDHTGSVFSCAVSPSGEWIVSGSEDKNLKLWEVRSGNPVYTFEAHQGAVETCLFDNSGKFIISGSRDNSIILWEVETGKYQIILDNYSKAIQKFALSKSNQWLIVAFDDGSLIVWDMKELRLHDEYLKHTGPILDCFISLNNQEVLSIGKDEIHLWNLHTTETLKTLKQKQPLIRRGIIHPHSSLVVLGDVDGTLFLWDWQQDEISTKFQSHTSRIESIIFDSTGDSFFSGSADFSIRRWHLHTRTNHIPTQAHSFWPTSCTLMPKATQDLAVSTGYSGEIVVWDANEGEIVSEWQGHQAEINSCSVSKHGFLATAANDGALSLWNLYTGQLIHSWVSDGTQMMDCEFCVETSKLLSLSRNNLLKLWDINSLECLLTLDLSIHTDYANCCTISADGRLACVGSWDETLSVWDLQKGVLLQHLIGHEAGIYACSITPDENYVVSASHDKSLRIWDVHEGTCRQVLQHHQDFVSDCAISLCGRWLLGTSEDETVSLWDLRSYEHLASLNLGRPLTCGTFINSETIMIGDAIGHIGFWKIKNLINKED